jgi:hypothetical protein
MTAILALPGSSHTRLVAGVLEREADEVLVIWLGVRHHDALQLECSRFYGQRFRPRFG